MRESVTSFKISSGSVFSQKPPSVFQIERLQYRGGIVRAGRGEEKIRAQRSHREEWLYPEIGIR